MTGSAMWQFTGAHRPDFARDPGPGEESVWDYPRPPQQAPDERTVEVFYADKLLAKSSRSVRILETASPPTFYLPAEDVDLSQLTVMPGRSLCEWKGAAEYVGVVSPQSEHPIGWRYPRPSEAFAGLAGWVSFYPGRADCRVNGERVAPQPGGFYGGWMTAEICGPVKGLPGTGHW
ncbi:MAG: DUF427 domain-containing protein [Lysobacterales bacterium]